VSVDSLIAGMGQEAALPRENGELVFAAPWESRVFAMAVALHEQGLYDWDVFRDRLVAEIGAHDGEDGGRYYERWLGAFERVLLDRDILGGAELEARTREVAHENDHGHDHAEGHEHHHHH
jgi:nitrile hydratase accessory protein